LYFFTQIIIDSNTKLLNDIQRSYVEIDRTNQN